MNRYADFSSGEVVKVHTLQLADFKKIALKNDKQRYRWCNHSHPGDMLQDMFLIRTRGDYVRPDKHINMPESHTIIEGREAIILFSDQGEITDAFLLDRNKGYLSYRINASIYHLTIPLTATAVDYEVKLGPFSAESNIYPEWAPQEYEIEKAKCFIQNIEDQIRKMGILFNEAGV